MRPVTPPLTNHSYLFINIPQQPPAVARKPRHPKSRSTALWRCKRNHDGANWNKESATNGITIGSSWPQEPTFGMTIPYPREDTPAKPTTKFCNQIPKLTDAMDTTCAFFYSIAFALLENSDWLCRRGDSEPEIWNHGRSKWASWWQCIWPGSRNVYWYRKLASGTFTPGRSLFGLARCPWLSVCLSLAFLGASCQLLMRHSDAFMQL